MKLVDSHCHLDFPEFGEDRKAVVTRAREAGVIAIVNPGTDLKSSRNAVWLAKEQQDVFCAIGLHPHEAVHYLSDGKLNEAKIAADLDQLRKLLGNPRLVAIGEIGLDFYRIADGVVAPGHVGIKDAQRELLKHQLDLAREANLPIILHCRQAYKEMFEILKPRAPLKGVVHCFEGAAEIAKRFFELGLFVSFTNNVSYDRSRSLAAAQALPLDRMLIETDAPFLPPEGMRGQRCEPAHVRNVAEKIAHAKGVSAEEVGEKTTENAKQLFGF